MRLNLLLLAALAGVLLASNAADAGQVTRVNGSIAKKTVWSGTVLVETPLTVTKGASLAVKPGTEVRFSKGAGLVVEGVLKAEGTKARPVVFTSAEKTPAPGDWSGISLSEAGEGTVLKRCVVSYAAAVSVAACSPVIQGCEIKNGVQGVAVARKGRPAVSKNVIKDMSEGGVNCQMGSAPVITGNTIERCAQYGVTSSQDAQPVIKDNVIAGCVSGLALSQGIPPIEGNTFKANKTGLLISSTGNSLVVRGNRFLDNGAGIVCQQFSGPLIDKNVITGNKDGLICFRASSPAIRNNDISRNGSGVICEQLCNPNITANDIHDNKRGIYLDRSSYAVINGNNIYGNGIQLELGNMCSDWEYRANRKFDRGGENRITTMASRGKAVMQQVADGSHIMGFVDATGNWWGGATTDEIESKGKDANIKSFIDYYDVPTRTYEGYSGVYVQDRIKYEGWKRSKIKNAGVN